MPGDRLELNALLAASLDSPVLMALDLRPGQSPTDIAKSARIAEHMVREKGADVLGVVVNMVRLSLVMCAAAAEASTSCAGRPAGSA